MLVRRPPELEWQIAGGLGVVGGAAYATLDRLAPEPGETLAVAGASGGVGSLAAQLAVARGVRVIGTTSAARADQVEALGVTPVLYGDGLLQRLREAAPEGADAALDASGHGELGALVELAGGAARVVSIAAYTEAQDLGGEFHARRAGGPPRPVRAARLPLAESRRIHAPVASRWRPPPVSRAAGESVASGARIASASSSSPRASAGGNAADSSSGVPGAGWGVSAAISRQAYSARLERAGRLIAWERDPNGCKRVDTAAPGRDP